MTNRYPKGSYIIAGKTRRKVLEELGDLRFLSMIEDTEYDQNWETESDNRVYHWKWFERLGWKEETSGDAVAKGGGGAGNTLYVFYGHGASALKKWISGDKYWWVSGSGDVCESTYEVGSPIDERYLSVGNCYRTREEAEAARERVLKAYKGE